MKNFTVLDLLSLELKEQNALNLTCICGRPGLIREITVPDLNRPGLALTGFFDNFGQDRIQVFGKGEVAYLLDIEKEDKWETIEKLFAYDIPCCIFAYNINPTEKFIKIAEAANCPVLKTDLTASELYTRLIRALYDVFAPKKTIHGVLIEVFGLGVLLQGNSGVGKSEAALELIERGHRLVSDDAVEVKCVSGNILMGSGANKVVGHHMEIRGLGIINITHLFGVGSIRDKKRIQLVVELEGWDLDREYDRIGAQGKTIDLLGVKIPYVLIPVKPGRNVPILIETAAMNERLKKMGYYSAREFNDNILKWLESENARSIYFQNEEMSKEND